MISRENIGFGKRTSGLWLVFWFLLLVCGHTSFGQNLSNRGNFETDVISGCAPLTVTPNILFSGTIGSVQYFYDNTLDPSACSQNYQLNPGACVNGTLTADTQFTYTTPGTYYIVQIIGTNPAPEVDFIEITVVDPVQPSFTTAVCGNNQVVLTFDFAQDDYDFYEINYGDGQPVQMHDKTGSNSVTYPYAAQGNYIIQVTGGLNSGSVVNCGVASPVNVTTLQVVPTPEITALTVIDAQTIQIDYVSLTDGVNYNLQLNQNGMGFSQAEAIDPTSNNQSLTFTSTDPGVNFNFGQFGVRLSASDVCATTENFSNAVQNVRAGYNASYTGNSILLSRGWNTQDPNSSLNAVRLVYDSTPEPVATTVMGNSDLTISSCLDARPFYFEADFGSAVSRSLTITPDLSVNPLSPPVPTGLAGQISNGALELSFDQALVTPVEYRIYRVSQAGLDLEGTTTNTSFSISNFSLSQSEICYTLTYVDECGHESATATQVCFQFTSSLVLPTAFTPNGDGQNDTFTVPNGIFLEFRMEIYNRWGGLIFVSTDASVGWNGLVNGKQAPPGGYVYHINYNSGQNSPVSLSGSFTLIR